MEGLNFGEIEEIPFNLDFNSWKEYYQAIIERTGKELVTKRVRVLNRARKYFQTYPNFSDMDWMIQDRLCGFHYGTEGERGLDKEIDWRTFETELQYEPSFTEVIKHDYSGISKALSKMPLEGEVTYKNYLDFFKIFNQTFKDVRHIINISLPIRLLSLKRPDYFVFLNKDFAINFLLDGPKNINISQIDLIKLYWKNLEIRFHNARWWVSISPADQLELSVWRGRVAMFECILDWTNYK